MKALSDKDTEYILASLIECPEAVVVAIAGVLPLPPGLSAALVQKALTFSIGLIEDTPELEKQKVFVHAKDALTTYLEQLTPTK